MAGCFSPARAEPPEDPRYATKQGKDAHNGHSPQLFDPAFIQERRLEHNQQEQLNALWNTNVEGFTQQAITGDPWNNLNAPIQTSYYDPTKTEIPADTAAALVTWDSVPQSSESVSRAEPGTAKPYGLLPTQLYQLADFGFYDDQNG